MYRSRNYTLTETERKSLRKQLNIALAEHDEVLFAYVHGSFVTNETFRDIDIAVFLRVIPESLLNFELLLESELNRVVRICQVDVRVLNDSPLSFRYNVIKDGMLLFARNDDERADFQEAVLSAYFDFAPHRNLYLKETLGSGV